MANEIQPGMTIRIGSRSWPVASLKEASEIFCAARERFGEGASNTPTPLLYRGTEPFGYVSYNGRVWAGTPQEWKPGAKPLYERGA